MLSKILFQIILTVVLSLSRIKVKAKYCAYRAWMLYESLIHIVIIVFS